MKGTKEELKTAALGQLVCKPSGKPFKSNLKTNTVKSVEEHPFRPGQLAFTFYEDDSYVSVEQCELFE